MKMCLHQQYLINQGMHWCGKQVNGYPECCNEKCPYYEEVKWEPTETSTQNFMENVEGFDVVVEYLKSISENYPRDFIKEPSKEEKKYCYAFRGYNLDAIREDLVLAARVRQIYSFQNRCFDYVKNNKENEK